MAETPRAGAGDPACRSWRYRCSMMLNRLGNLFMSDTFIHLKNAFPGEIGNRRILFEYNLWFASHPSLPPAQVGKKKNSLPKQQQWWMALDRRTFTTCTFRSDNGTHGPSKTTLSQWVATSTTVEMGGAVHARTSNTWQTDKHALGCHGGVGSDRPHALGWHGDWGATTLVRVNEGGRRPRRVHIFEFCRLFFSLRGGDYTDWRHHCWMSRFNFRVWETNLGALDSPGCHNHSRTTTLQRPYILHSTLQISHNTSISTHIHI